MSSSIPHFKSSNDFYSYLNMNDFHCVILHPNHTPQFEGIVPMMSHGDSREVAEPVDSLEYLVWYITVSPQIISELMFSQFESLTKRPKNLPHPPCPFCLFCQLLGPFWIFVASPNYFQHIFHLGAAQRWILFHCRQHLKLLFQVFAEP